MALDLTSVLNKVAAAKVTKGGTTIRDGLYLFALVNFLIEQKESGRCCIIELFVKESKSKSGLVESDGRPRTAEANAAGTTCSVVINLDAVGDAGRMAPANVKAFVCGIAGMDPGSVDDDKFVAFASKMADKSQPLRGMLVADDTFARAIKKGPRAGQMFVGHNWNHVAGQTRESIATQRAELERIGVAAPV